MKKLKEVPRVKLPKESIATLSAVTQKIKSGEITSLAFVALGRDGNMITAAWTHEGHLSLIGGLERCKMRVLEDVASWGTV